MSKSWKLHHIAVIVRDIDKAVEYYQSIGIATPEREVKFPEAKPNIRAKWVHAYYRCDETYGILFSDLC